MSETNDILRRIAGGIRAAFSILTELEQKLGDPTAAPEALDAWHAILRLSGAEAVIDTVPDVSAIIAKLEQLTADDTSVLQRLALITEVGNEIGKLAQALAAVRLMPGVTPEQFVASLTETVLLASLARRAPFLFPILHALGIIERRGRGFRIAFDQIGALFSNPGKFLEQRLGPSAMDDDAGASRVAELVLQPLADLPLGRYAFFGYDGAPGDPPFLLLTVDDPTLPDVGLALEVTTVSRARGGPGFRFSVDGHAAVKFEPVEGLELSASIDANDLLSVLLKYDGTIAFATPSLGTLKVGIASKRTEPLYLGDPDSTRLEIGTMRGELFITGDDVGFSFDTKDNRFVVSGEDGFLRTLLPDGLNVDFEFGMTWSWRDGVRFKGGAGIAIDLPLHIDAGPLQIDGLGLRFGFGARETGFTIDLRITTSVGVTIGPVSASISGIGLALGFAPGKPGGNVGFGHFELPRLALPTGISLGIEAGPVHGAGLLLIDAAAGRYAGALQLSIFGVGLTAVCIVDTKVPGVPYSLLILIDLQLPAIQLGFGFTLLGVGGLAGIHRRMDDDRAREGLQSGALDAVLNPAEAMQDIGSFLSRLSAIFPVAEGRHVFGPKITIGWGTPSIIEARVALLLEVPDPFKIILLGQVDMLLPSPDAAVIELHLDVLGVVDFGKKLFALDASLHDSRIGPFFIEGDLALRISWGDRPYFLLSLGGFHPAFRDVPPGVPNLRRIAVGIKKGPIKVCIEAYFALTSNSVQLGVKANVDVDLFVVRVRGWLSFDALIVFNPFSFMVDVTAGLEILVLGVVVAGITLEGHVSGPNPWHIRGKIKISILFIHLEASVEVEVGEREAELPPPTIDPWELLRVELEDATKLSNWSVDEQDRSPFVTLRPREGRLVLTPLAELSFRQRAVPLNRTLSRVGQAIVEQPIALQVESVSVGGTITPWENATPLTDMFAAASYDELSDDAKLTRPSFERMDAGFVIGARAAEVSRTAEAALGYEATFVNGGNAQELVGFDLELDPSAPMTPIARAHPPPTFFPSRARYRLGGGDASKDAELAHTVGAFASLRRSGRGGDVRIVRVPERVR